MSNPIPTAQREAVHRRDRGICLACGGRAVEVHHRRTRAIRDAHCHCLCVLVSLCRLDHARAHAAPKESEGFMISRFTTQPTVVPLRHYSLGWVLPACDGGWEPQP